MELAKAIIVNRMVMALISSKYSGLSSGCFTAPDANYYRQLDHDIEAANWILGREAPSPQKISSYIRRVNVIVESLDKNGSHKFKRSPSQVP